MAAPIPGGIGSSKNITITETLSTLNNVTPLISFPTHSDPSTAANIKNAEVINPKDPAEIQYTINDLTAKITNNPKNVTALVHRAEHYLALNDLSNAENDFKDACLQDMKNPRIFKGLGEIAFLKKDYDRACKTLNKALELSQDDIDFQSPVKVLLSKAVVQQNILLGNASSQNKNYTDALKFYTKAYKEVAEEDPLVEDLESLLDNSFKALSAQYEKLVSEDKLDEATVLVEIPEDVFDILSKEDKRISNRMRGLIYLKRNWIERAKEFFKDSKEPEDIDRLGRCNFLSADYNLSINVYIDAINNPEVQLTPTQREDFFSKIVLISLFLRNEAIYAEMLNQFNQEFPGSISCVLFKGFELYLSNFKNQQQGVDYYEKSTESYKEYLKQRPNCFFGNILLSKNYFDNRSYAEVIEHLSKVIEKDPYNFLAREIRGQTYEALGHIKDAFSDFCNCVKHLFLDANANSDTFTNRLTVCKYVYILHLANRTEEALQILDRLQKLDFIFLEEDQPRTSEIDYSYARIHFDTKNYIDAVRHLISISQRDVKDCHNLLMVKCLEALGTMEELEKAKRICRIRKGKIEFDALHQSIESKISALKAKPRTINPQSQSISGAVQRKRSGAVQRNRTSKLEKEEPKETPEQKAEREEKVAKDKAQKEALEAQKKAADEALRLENRKKLEEANIKRIEEERAQLKAEKERKRVEAEKKAASKKEAAPSTLPPSSSSGRSGQSPKNQEKEKTSPSVPVASEKRALTPASPAPAKTKNTNPIAPKPPIPTPPVIQVFRATLGAAKIAPRSVFPRVMLEPIGNHLPSFIPLTSNHLQLIEHPIQILDVIEKILNTQNIAHEEMVKRILVLRLRDFTDAINNAKGDPQFAKFFESVVNHNNFEKLRTYLHSPRLMYNIKEIEGFCKNFLSSDLCKKLRGVYEKKFWAIPHKLERIRVDYPYPSLNSSQLRNCIAFEIQFLYTLSITSLNILERRLFKQSLRVIIAAAQEPQLNNEVAPGLYISRLESFLEDPFDFDEARRIANHLSDSTLAIQVNYKLDFID